MKPQPFLAILSSSLLCIFCTTQPAYPVLVDRIVAVVNGEIITQREVMWLLAPLYERYGKEYTGAKLKSRMQEAEQDIVDQLIDDKLVMSEAKRLAIEVTEREIEGRLEEIQKRFLTEEEFRQMLASQDVSLSELKEKIKDDIRKSKVIKQEVGWKVVITPAEVREYYDKHIDDFVTPEKVRVLDILIRREAEDRSPEESRFLADKVMELIAAGAEFEDIAKEYSESAVICPRLIEKGQMIKDIDDALFSAEAGGVTGVVDSQLGYHIFKVMEKIQAETVGFEEARIDIENLIYKNKIEKSLKKWLQVLRKNAYIAIR